MFFRTKNASDDESTVLELEDHDRLLQRRRVQSSPYYDALIRHLQSIRDSLIGNEPRAIGITSCHGGEEVTAVAINLARAATKFIAGPILLVDANAERPAITHMVKARRHDGLVNVLAGDVNMLDCVVDSAIEGVSVMPLGKFPEGEQPIYDAASIEEALESLRHVFPLIIMELPRASELTACLALAGKLDGALVVVEPDRVETATARRAKQQLKDSGAALLGVVFVEP